MRLPLVVGTLLSIVGSLIVGHRISRADPSFEQLPICQKLGIIQGDGKSVQRYIADSGFDLFAEAIATTCPQYLIELGEAWEIMLSDSKFSSEQTFERISQCEQLNAIKASQKSVSEHIRITGYDLFVRPVLDDCPGHLKELGFAWKNIYGEGSSPTPENFEDLPPCEKLRRVALDGKSVADYIQNSGVGQFESAIRQSCPAYENALNTVMQNQAQNDPAFSFSSPLPRSSSDAFEQLPPCQKLDVVQGTDKSVADYLAESGYEPFRADVYRLCQRHLGALESAMVRSE